MRFGAHAPSASGGAAHGGATGGAQLPAAPPRGGDGGGPGGAPQPPRCGASGGGGPTTCGPGGAAAGHEATGPGAAPAPVGARGATAAGHNVTGRGGACGSSWRCTWGALGTPTLCMGSGTSAKAAQTSRRLWGQRSIVGRPPLWTSGALFRPSLFDTLCRRHGSGPPRARTPRKHLRRGRHFFNVVNSAARWLCRRMFWSGCVHVPCDFDLHWGWAETSKHWTI